jgi:hypothetical protein
MLISTVIEKIEKEMLDEGLIIRVQTPKQEERIRFYHTMIYTAGVDEGRKQYSHRKPIAQFTIDGKFIKVFGSIVEAANSIHRTKGAVQKAVAGKTEHSGGFKWKYIENVTLEDCR